MVSNTNSILFILLLLSNFRLPEVGLIQIIGNLIYDKDTDGDKDALTMFGSILILKLGGFPFYLISLLFLRNIETRYIRYLTMIGLDIIIFLLGGLLSATILLVSAVAAVSLFQLLFVLFFWYIFYLIISYILRKLR